jgi:hypothetical protein
MSQSVTSYCYVCVVLFVIICYCFVMMLDLRVYVREATVLTSVPALLVNNCMHARIDRYAQHNTSHGLRVFCLWWRGFPGDCR